MFSLTEYIRHLQLSPMVPDTQCEGAPDGKADDLADEHDASHLAKRRLKYAVADDQYIADDRQKRTKGYPQPAASEVVLDSFETTGIDARVFQHLFIAAQLAESVVDQCATPVANRSCQYAGHEGSTLKQQSAQHDLAVHWKRRSSQKGSNEESYISPVLHIYTFTFRSLSAIMLRNALKYALAEFLDSFFLVCCNPLARSR